MHSGEKEREGERERERANKHTHTQQLQIKLYNISIRSDVCNNKKVCYIKHISKKNLNFQNVIETTIILTLTITQTYTVPTDFEYRIYDTNAAF